MPRIKCPVCGTYLHDSDSFEDECPCCEAPLELNEPVEQEDCNGITSTDRRGSR